MSASLVVVTPMTPDDLDEIVFLERRCFADPWTRHIYLSDLTTNEMATYLTLRIADGRRPRSVANGAELPSTTNDQPLGLSDQLLAISHQRSAILAYGGFWLMVDEAHIATVASHPGWRGCGLGQWLMLALLDAAIARGAVRSTLEVRAGNLPARRLYAKLGYEVVGMRRCYYRDGEDGLIMTTPRLADPAMQARLAAARVETTARLKRCFKAQSPHN